MDQSSSYAAPFLGSCSHVRVGFDEWPPCNGLDGPQDRTGGFPCIESVAEHGTAYWVYMVYSYVVAAMGIYLFVRHLARSGNVIRWQTAVFIVVVSVPWAASIITDILKISPFYYIEMTPVVLCVSLPTMGWILDRLWKKDFIPRARAAVINSVNDCIFAVDADNQIVDANAALYDLLDQNPKRILGKPVQAFFSQWPDWLRRLEESKEASLPVDMGLMNQSRIYDLRVSPLDARKGGVAGNVIVLRDVTNQVEAENQIVASLNEKEILLKEIYHRVKNNLQIISSLLNLQYERIQDPRYHTVLKESQNRIHSMALVHEVLYRSENMSQIEFSNYIRMIVQHLASSYGVENQVRFDFDTM